MKIAFLFLIITKHNQYDIWEQYLSTMSPDSYSIYCHPKDPYKVTQPLLKQNIINNLAETARGVFTQAYVNLLDAAYQDTSNTHFCLITESCVPIKSSEYMLKFVKRYSDNGKRSIIHWWPINSYNWSVRYLTRIEETDFQYPKDKFKKHSTYCILNREDTSTVLRARGTSEYKFLVDMRFGGDEHFLSLLWFSDPSKNKHTSDRMTTYANWDYRDKKKEENKKIYWEQYDRFKDMRDKWSPEKQEAFQKYVEMLHRNYRESSGHPQLYVSISNSDIKKFVEIDTPFARKFAEISNIKKFWDVMISQIDLVAKNQSKLQKKTVT